GDQVAQTKAALDLTDYASLGTHVASVVEASERASARIREEVHAELDGTRKAAHEEAAAKLMEATDQASKILHDAEALRAEAETASVVTRERADAYAVKKRKDADEEALKVLETAEHVAARQHTEMPEREQSLGARLEHAEKRVGDLIPCVRDLAGHPDA